MSVCNKSPGFTTVASVLAGVPIGFVVVDRTGTIVSVNPAYPAIVGRGPNPIKSGATFVDTLIGVAELETVQTMLEAVIREGKVREIATTEYAADGERRVILRTLSPLRGVHGQVDGALVSAMNQSALYAATEQLEKALDKLKKAQQTIILREKMAGLGNLVAGIAHEINTPVGNAFTASSILADESAAIDRAYHGDTLTRSELEDFVATTAESTRIILSNLNRAAELIRSFKLVSADQTSEESRRFAVAPYIREVITSLRPRFKRRRIEVLLQIDEHLEVVSVPGLISQVVTNLIVNALDHAFGPDDQGAIVLTGTAEDQGWSLVVEDNGRGIKKDIQSQVFDPFFTTARGSGGTGLGLHIVYTIVSDNLGGQIEVKSQEGQGTSFLMRFPFVEQDRAPTHVGAAAPPSVSDGMLPVRDAWEEFS